MKTKKEIVDNWLPRYTGTALENFGEHVLLTNFGNYLDLFAAQTGAAIVGLAVVQLCGLANLLLGGLVQRWNGALPQLLLSYSLGPLVPQLLLCCAVAVLALPLRRLLLVES